MLVTTIHKTTTSIINLISQIAFLLIIIILPFVSSGCMTTPSSVKDTDQIIPELADYSPGNADDLLIVDCLLPGKINRLGNAITYVTPRRAVKTTALSCRIRGGEYVAYDRSNYETALKVWLSKANEGDKVAQTYAGEIYEKGLGREPDYALAAKWYQKAADQGYERAQINLGHLYEKGLGVEKNPVKALTLYRKASGLQEGITLDPGSLGSEANKKIEELSREIESRKSETESLRKQLEQTRLKLEEAQQELKQKESDAEAERQKLEIEQQELSMQKRLASSAYKSFEEQLEQREVELEQQRQEITGINQEITLLNTKANNLKENQQELEEDQSKSNNLEQTKRELENTQLALERKKNEFEIKQHELASAQQELEKQKRTASSDYAKIKNLEEQLKQRKILIANKDKEIIGMSRKIKLLERQAEVYNNQLEDLKKIQLALPGPSIVLINPPLVATRGIRIVNVSSDLEMEHIIEGKVIAPAGLSLFTVNDRNEKVDKNEIFRVPINVKNANVPVKLFAKDKQEKSTTIEFQLTPGDQKSRKKKKNLLPSKSFGNYYALIIGNKNYTIWPKLETPETDALVLAQLLSSKYGFKTKVLIDTTRYELLQALNELRMELKETDNLLIYYAGHGHLEEKISRGYWIPVDADLNSNTRWISTIQIADILSIMSVNHVLIIADSCYSGALTRSSLARLETGMSDEARRHWIKVMMKKRSRTALTSGDLQPVIDKGGGDHSVFAKALLDVLKENDDVIEGQILHKEISARVTYAASAVEVEQVPQYAPMRFAGHESGEFFFVPSIN